MTQTYIYNRKEINLKSDLALPIDKPHFAGAGWVTSFTDLVPSGAVLLGLGHLPLLLVSDLTWVNLEGDTWGIQQWASGASIIGYGRWYVSKRRWQSLFENKTIEMSNEFNDSTYLPLKWWNAFNRHCFIGCRYFWTHRLAKQFSNHEGKSMCFTFLLDIQETQLHRTFVIYVSLFDIDYFYLRHPRIL